MKFGERYTKKCVTCGKDFEGFTSSKYCSDACKPQNRKHRKKEPKEKIENDTSNTTDIVKLDGNGNPDDGGTGLNGVNGADNGVYGDSPVDSKQDMTVTEVNSIQIIDSNTGKKDKGIIDQIFEKAFSEEFAPITTSLLGALVAKLQQPNNATEEGILTADDGSKHAMI